MSKVTSEPFSRKSTGVLAMKSPGVSRASRCGPAPVPCTRRSSRSPLQHLAQQGQAIAAAAQQLQQDGEVEPVAQIRRGAAGAGHQLPEQAVDILAGEDAR